jgi:hypothetical protein
MNEIIKGIKNINVYILGNKKIHITYYADKAVLMADNGNYSQRLLHQFLLGSQKYEGKSISKLQMDIELKQIRVLI